MTPSPHYCSHPHFEWSPVWLPEPRNLYFWWFQMATATSPYLLGRHPLLFSCCIQLFATPWTVALRALLSMEFTRHGGKFTMLEWIYQICHAGVGLPDLPCWRGFPFPSPRGSSWPWDGTSVSSSPWQAGSLPLSHQGNTGDIHRIKQKADLKLIPLGGCKLWRNSSSLRPSSPWFKIFPAVRCKSSLMIWCCEPSGWKREWKHGTQSPE